jgi:UDP-3-O-[3-hydroxymyristoyl] glucosamine N-acyltransferase
MYRLKKIDIYASEIAGYLNQKLIGDDFIVNFPGAVKLPEKNNFIFFNKIEDYSNAKLQNITDLLVILPEQPAAIPKGLAIIVSPDPRMDFIKVVNEYFTEYEGASKSQNVIISPLAIIGRNVHIGNNVVVGPDVVIGENTQIFNNVVIKGRVLIGNDCVIKDNSTIGSTGYNFVFNEWGLPVTYPNIGKIIIGNNVWVGSNASVESPSFENTFISDFVKIDDLVHIGYNSIIGEKSLITAGSVISRNVVIGAKCVLGPNSSVAENITIQDNVVVGLGAVVVSNLNKNGVYIGNPARFHKSNI